MQNFAENQDLKPLAFLQIIKYWLPEAASASCLIFLPIIADLLLVAKLKSTPTYSAIGVSSNLIHTLIKLAEGVCIAGISIMGRFNGAKKFADCGRAFLDSLAATSILGAVQFGAVSLGAGAFMRWIEAPEAVRAIAIPFIKVQAIAIFSAFILMACIGFFKAVKETQAPFFINVMGILIFLFFDYALILGKCGFPALGYMGSAIAANIRYFSMLALSAALIFGQAKYKKYFLDLGLVKIRPQNVFALIKLSLPIMIDKTMLSFSYIWLAKMVAPFGICAIACMDSVKNVERLAFIPAMGFAQIITFIVSNNIGEGNPQKAKANISRILFLTIIASSSGLSLACYKSGWLISFLDPTNSFSNSACKILKAISPLVIFDLIQLILSAALRGAGDVKTVMLTRLSICTLFFLPLSFAIKKYVNLSPDAKIILIYASFYLATAIMALILLARIQGQTWHRLSIPSYKRSAGATEEEAELIETQSPSDAEIQ
jgi:MATE family multidrug resistance protein